MAIIENHVPVVLKSDSKEGLLSEVKSYLEEFRKSYPNYLFPKAEVHLLNSTKMNPEEEQPFWAILKDNSPLQ